MHIRYIIPICIALLAQSCEVTRTITTVAETTKSGDKTTTITTKTTEQYTGIKK